MALYTNPPGGYVGTFLVGTRAVGVRVDGLVSPDPALLHLGAVAPTLQTTSLLPELAAGLALGAVAPDFAAQVWLHPEQCLDLVLAPSFPVGSGAVCGAFLCGQRAAGARPTNFIQEVVPV